MKQRILLSGFLSLFIFGLIAFVLMAAGPGDKDRDQLQKINRTEANGFSYLSSIRNNQFTGTINPNDVMQARKQAASQAKFKSGAVKDFTWTSLGPNNMGGRTRAVLFDNRDANANTVYAACVTGGIFKSTNLGGNWNKVNTGNTLNLNITCMIQADNGTIYAATGEGFNTDSYTATGQFGYDGGFIGQGIFKSDNNDNFSQIASTTPYMQGDTMQWAYINKIALDKKGGRLFAATNTGLKWSDLSTLNSWHSDFKHQIDSIKYDRAISIDSVVSCDSFSIVNGNLHCYGSTGWQIEITSNDTTNENVIYREYVPFESASNCYDVKISPDGWIITTFDNLIYVSEDGDVNKFVNRSIYPTNPESFRQDSIRWTSHLVIKDKMGNVLKDSSTVFSEVYDWHTDYFEEGEATVKNFPSSTDGGRTEFALSPSNPSIVYAMVAKGTSPSLGSLVGIYLSEDAGMNWGTVAPGGSALLNILGDVYGTNTKYYQGNYSNTLAVFPNDPHKILAGGVNMWLGYRVDTTGGYYAWDTKTVGDASLPSGLFQGIYNPFYCHKNHHIYAFRPGHGNEFIAGTDGGIFYGTVNSNIVTMQSINKSYRTSQFYSIDISNREDEYVGGTQDNGPLYVSGIGTSPRNAEDMWRNATLTPNYPIGTDGGSVAFSNIRLTTTANEPVPPAVFYMRSPVPDNAGVGDRARRSQSLGFDYSGSFLSGDISDSRFITPMLLWENYNDVNSAIYVQWIANKNYAAGDNITVRSHIYMQPFNYTLDDTVNEGDTLLIQDIISNKLFVGVSDEVWMTLESSDFGVSPEWLRISERNHNGVDGNVQSMAYSADGNYLWVGTDAGGLYRISGIAYAFDYNTADVSSSNCIIATSEVSLGEVTQIVTSVSVDPKNPDKVLVTLGNYGNTDYVYYCTNGTSDTPQFTSIQGNLPQAPVYSSILEMDPATDMAILGTEMGLWASDNVGSGEWYMAAPEIGELPVMAIKQQTVFKTSYSIAFIDPVTQEPSYETYPGIDNFRDIYVATHGRGVFKADLNSVGIDENPVAVNDENINFNIYPNPAVGDVKIMTNLTEKTNLVIKVYDLTGKLIMENKLGEINSGENRVSINTSILDNGTYIVQLAGNKSISSKKLIILK